MKTTTLYRPVGPAELALIEASGWKAFPPRLPEQPIFYPVMNEAYAILGSLLGTAVGDALGLPSEGMSRMRIARRWNGLRHRLVFGRGLFSDDTEHTLMCPITRRRSVAGVA